MGTTAEIAQTYNTWEAILAFLDTPSSDGRMLAADGYSCRPLPLTLAFMPATDDGHDGSYPVGRIDKVWVDGQKLMGSGVWDSTPEAQDAGRMVDERMQYEISIDPTLQEYTQRFPLDWQEEVIVDENGDQAVEITESVDDYLMTYTKWELAGATIVNGAAFGETEISVTSAAQPEPPPIRFAGAEIHSDGKPFAGDPDDDEADGAGAVAMIALYPDLAEATALSDGPEDEAPEEMHLTLAVFTEEPDAALITQLLTDFAGTQPPLAGDVTGVGVFSSTGATDPVPVIALADVLGLADLRTDLCDVLEAAAVPYAEDHDFVPHITLEYQATAPVVASSDDPAIGQTLTFAALSYVTMAGDRQDFPLTATDEAGEAVTASAIGRAPEAPPLAWFEAPLFDEPTPMEFTDEGHVYGHAALFGVCHTGINDRCLTLDRLRSGTNYAYFHTGYLVTAEGEKVRVGQITLGTDHPGLSMDAQGVAQHYANTGTVACDVVVGEDEFGLWVTGALRPDFPASRLRELRAATLSGDWRPIHRSAELMALLAVNVPGYPVIAPEALAASGMPESDPPLLGAIGVGVILPGSIHSAEPSEAGLTALRAAAGGLPALREAAGL